MKKRPGVLSVGSLGALCPTVGPPRPAMMLADSLLWRKVRSGHG